MKIHKALYKHQRQAFKFCNSVKHPALYMEMRLGKTLTAIRCCRQSYLNIVFAPNSALDSWENELQTEGLTCINLSGLTTKLKQEKLQCVNGLNLAPLWVLINKESCLTSAGKQIALIQWDNVILDEAHFIKNPKAKTTKYFLKNFNNSNRWCLTGTPNSKGTEDFVCLELFRHRICMGMFDYWSWQNKYTHLHPSGFGRVLNKGAQLKLLSEVKKTAFTLTRKEAGINVKEIKEIRKLIFPPKFKKLYKTVESDFEINFDGKVQTTVWSGQRRVWLRQICSGIVHGELVEHFKINELLYLLNTELIDQQVVVWFQYNSEIFAVEDLLTKSKISCCSITGDKHLAERQKILNLFRNGSIRVLLLQQAVAQTGMNLSCADTAIYFSLPDGLLGYKQTKDRIVSIQKAGVLLLYLIVKDTIEEDLYMGMVVQNLRSQKELDYLLMERFSVRMGINNGNAKMDCTG